MKILDLLTVTIEQKEHRGLWASGIGGEGEFKEWWDDGQLYVHSNWKNGILHGDYKQWHEDGVLYIHSLWEEGDLIEDYIANEKYTRTFKTKNVR